MTKHHPLDFQKFIECVPPDLMVRYFNTLNADHAPSGWAALNGDALEDFLSDPRNSELDGLIRDDLRRFNDLASYAVSILLEAYERFSLDLDLSHRPEHLAMSLFLDNKTAWDFAWSRYLLYALDSKLTVLHFPARELDFGEERVGDFRRQVGEVLKGQAKGEQCDVRSFNFDGQQIVYIERGSYLRTITFWEEEEIQIKCYRPALEDVIALNSESGELLVKAGQERERDDYVRLFAHCFAGDMTLGEEALRSKTFDLDPVANGSFNYQGGGALTGVDLVGVRLKLPFSKRATLDLRSQDIFETLEALPDISLGIGELVSARFRFNFAEGKRVRTVTFEVAPPARTDLPENNYTRLINMYLVEQGVKLR